MAGDWIKVESATPDKPELSIMADSLGIDQDAVFGKLFRVWAWADQNIDIDGNGEGNDDSVTVRVTKTLIDRIALCPGFAAAMQAVGWLLDDGGEMTLPNFRRHNGKSAKNRSVTAKRVAKFKNKGNDKGNDKGNGASVTKNNKDALPREEKSIKEKDKKETPAVPADESLGDKAQKPKATAVAIDTWLDALKAEGQDAIPAGDPIFDYAEKAGIPFDFLSLSWYRFCEVMRDGGKRKKDWRAHYRNAVKGNWYKLWWFSPDDGCRLTTQGEQARRALT